MNAIPNITRSPPLPRAPAQTDVVFLNLAVPVPTLVGVFGCKTWGLEETFRQGFFFSKRQIGQNKRSPIAKRCTGASRGLLGWVMAAIYDSFIKYKPEVHYFGSKNSQCMCVCVCVCMCMVLKAVIWFGDWFRNGKIACKLIMSIAYIVPKPNTDTRGKFTYVLCRTGLTR